jgi:hypothetical protein
LTETQNPEDELLERSGACLAARLIADKWFDQTNVKFVTNLKYEGRWIAAQWVITSFGLSVDGTQVFAGRVGISRRRRTAFARMVAQSWRSGGVTEPRGPTLGVQIYAKLGN